MREQMDQKLKTEDWIEARVKDFYRNIEDYFKIDVLKDKDFQYDAGNFLTIELMIDKDYADNQKIPKKSVKSIVEQLFREHFCEIYEIDVKTAKLPDGHLGYNFYFYAEDFLFR